MLRTIHTIICVYFILAPNLLFGQSFNKHQIITGKVVANADSICSSGTENVTVKLFIGNETLSIGNTSTKNDGTFSLFVDPVKYSQSNKIKLEFSHLQFKVKRLEISLDPLLDTLVLEDIILDREGLNIDTVYVFSEEKEIEYTNGKIVMNITKSAGRNAINAFDLLKRVPGLVVNGTGISLMARENVLILLDGKRLGMNTQETLGVIQNMPSNNIEKIEMISNPPAKYDADGYGGIINIVTRKNLSDGLLGNINWAISHGDYFKTTPSINLDFSANKLKTTFAISTPFNKNGQLYINERKLPSDIVINQEMGIISHTKGLNSRFRLSYDIDSNSNLGFGFGLNTLDNTNNFEGTTGTSVREQMDNTMERFIYEDKSNSTALINVDYNKKIKRGNLTLLGDYIIYRNSQKTKYSTFGGNEPNNRAQFNIRNPTKTDIRTIQIDLEQKMLGGDLNLGVKLSNISTKNNFEKDSLFNEGWSNISNQTSDFRYDESNFASYASFYKSIDTTLSAEIGIRYEHTLTHSKLNSIATNDFKTDYGKLFPSISITKKNGAGGNLIKLSLGRRISRPNYQDLNPFLFYIDQYDYSSGNPYLKPSTATTLDLIYLLKNQMMFFVGYTDSKDEFQKIIEQNENSGIAIERYENLAKYSAISFNSTIPLRLNKRWEMYNVFNVSYRNYVSPFGDNKGMLFQFFTEQSVKISKNLNSFLSFNYALSDAYGLYEIRPYWIVNVGFNKKFTNNFELKFNINDLFKSNDRLTIARYLNVNQRTRNIYEGRIYQVNFSYKFGNRNVKVRKRKASDADEKNRL